MRSGAYPYPADEFDAAARAGGPRGVHRAPRSRWSRWWPFLVVLVVFPVLAYGIVTWLSDWDGLSSFGDEPVAEGTTDDDTGTDTEAPPTETSAPTESETPVETPTPEPPPVDLARPIEVFNSTNSSGLARNGADRLTAAGFTTIDVADWDGADPATSVVYYGVATDITTAQQVATALGLPVTAATESADLAPAGIVVVLAGDYQRV